jgi:hypothetical protein
MISNRLWIFNHVIHATIVVMLMQHWKLQWQMRKEYTTKLIQLSIFNCTPIHLGHRMESLQYQFVPLYVGPLNAMYAYNELQIYVNDLWGSLLDCTWVNLGLVVIEFNVCMTASWMNGKNKSLSSLDRENYHHGWKVRVTLNKWQKWRQSFFILLRQSKPK